MGNVSYMVMKRIWHGQNELCSWLDGQSDVQLQLQLHVACGLHSLQGSLLGLHTLLLVDGLGDFLQGQTLVRCRCALVHERGHA